VVKYLIKNDNYRFAPANKKYYHSNRKVNICLKLFSFLLNFYL
jgi:hypothetical protein